jgi:signal transduction histidine kinase
MPSNISKTNPVISVPESYSEQINLNDVLRQALQQRLQYEKKNSDIIIRCDVLPVVETDRKKIIGVFDHIVQMIISHPPNGARLFLYVNCEEEHTAMTGADVVKRNKRYKVNFHTNISTDEAWKKAHEKTIAGCKAVVAQYGASFTVNDIKSTGCLFSISLLGKM